MSFQNENALRHSLFDTAGQMGIFTERFEMPERLGLADTIFARGPIAFWAELKIGLPSYRPGQLPWARNAAERGQVVRTIGFHASRFYVLDTSAAAELVLDEGPRKPSDFAPLMIYHISAATLLDQALHDAEVAVVARLRYHSAAPLRVDG